MTAARSAASLAPMLACIVALALAPAPARAQAAQPRTAATTPGLLQLPAVRARPPVRAAAAARPAATRRDPVAPALLPTTPLSEAKLPPNGETLAQISAATVNAGRPRLPLGPGLRGPSVLRVQVLLDRASFSPGMIDGSWGRNTSISVYWFQAREGLPPTGVVDSATYARLEQVAGRPAELVRRQVLEAADVRGPFTEIPGNIYEQAKLDCSCYESLAEKLTELFHSRAELLRQLNPGVALNQLKAGDALLVPNVRDAAAPPAGQVQTLVVSGADHYLQALDASGRILYHFPTTLGSSYDPSPEGSFTVLAITENPWWHYQPAILHHGHEDAPDAQIPPGPNSAVGKVWMTLSSGHYGIHGTKSPETIGYAVSAGCVRLTNWDALYLARRMTAGTPVVFRGTRTRTVARPAPAAPAGPALVGVRSDSTPRQPAPADSARRDSTRRDSTGAPSPAPVDSSAARAAAPPVTPPTVTPAPAPAPATPAPATPAPVRSDSAAKP
jgi:lipoprotein-anchoring transpeptidase ErfK/SrfK